MKSNDKNLKREDIDSRDEGVSVYESKQKNPWSISKKNVETLNETPYEKWKKRFSRLDTNQSERTQLDEEYSKDFDIFNEDQPFGQES